MNKFNKIKLRVLGYKEIRVAGDDNDIRAFSNGNKIIFESKEKICKTNINLDKCIKNIRLKLMTCGYHTIELDTEMYCYIDVGKFISENQPYMVNEHMVVFKADKDYAIYLFDENETILLHNNGCDISNSDNWLLNEKLDKNRIRTFCEDFNFREVMRLKGLKIKKMYLFE